MTIKAFSPLYMTKLSINDVFSLLKSSNDIAQPQIAIIGVIANGILTTMSNDNTAMGSSLNKVAKSLLTDELKEINADRSTRLSEIKRVITTNVKGRDATKQTAAEGVKNFFSPYWNVDTDAMNTETGDIADLIAKYRANAEVQAQAAIIGIDGFMNELETVNNNFDVVYKARIHEKTDTMGASASELKPAAIKSYEQFCTSIEQVVNFAPSDALNTLFNNLDELRKKYSLLVHPAKVTPIPPVVAPDVAVK